MKFCNDLEDMLACFNAECYRGMGGLITTVEELSEAQVFLPETIYEMFDHVTALAEGTEKNKCVIEIWKTDTLSAAKKISDSGVCSVTALVFGHPASPGGSIRKLKREDVAQEEAICAHTSLLLSLESHGAEPYYEFQRQDKSFQTSDAVLFSPNVLIVDKKQNRVTHKISCITSAAPMCSVFTERLEDVSDFEMDRIWLQRWTALFVVLAHLKCKFLILGAWGCGAFSNSPQRVSATLRKVFENNMHVFFEHIVIAIPDQKKYDTFFQNLVDYIQTEGEYH